MDTWLKSPGSIVPENQIQVLSTTSTFHNSHCLNSMFSMEFTRIKYFLQISKGFLYEFVSEHIIN